MQLRQPKDLGQRLNSVYGLKYLWWNFSIIGIHPPDADVHHPVWRSLYFVYAVVINFLAAFCLPASMLANLVLVKSWQEIIGNLSLSITIAVSTTKQLAIFRYRRLLLKANDYLQQLDERCSVHPQDRMNVLNGIRYCHWFFTVYISFYAFCAVGFAYIGWANHQLVYNAWFPVLFASERQNYVAAYIFQNFAQTFTVFQNGNNDMYPLCYITLMISHLRALGDRIKRVGTDTKMSEEDNVEELRKCILDHKNVQAYFECIRPVISSTMFQQLCIAAFTLCLTAVNLVAFDRTFAEKVFSIVYLGVILIQIFPACLAVNLLMEETSYLTTAMYSCNWMDQNRTFRRMLIIFMQRSQKTNVINAGNLTPVTLQTFLAIIKFSFSMYTLFSQMKIQ